MEGSSYIIIPPLPICTVAVADLVGSAILVAFTRNIPCTFGPVTITPQKSNDILLFFNQLPGQIGIVRFHVTGDLGGFRSQIFLVHPASLVNDEGHDP